MKTDKEVKDYALAAKNWLYVWGANGEKITPEMMSRLYKNYGSSKYNRAYYDKKLAAGSGKMAADCSGFLKPLSGYDDTADGYYSKCRLKGTVGSLPQNKVVLVFKQNSAGRMYHVGIYLGDGTVAEMASSDSNYQRRNVGVAGWTHWGQPGWISYVAADDNLDLQIKLPSLVRGARSSYVRTLQQILAARGYDTNGIDGIFGTATEQAVKQYQNAAGVQVNYPGTVGAKTWSALLGGK